jgi:phospholipid/cholesterol/gamma-HCH transport system ATP-binding protein
MHGPVSTLSDALLLQVRDVVMQHGDHVVQRGLSFSVRRGEVFVIAGASGCGKSTLLRHLIGLQRPAAGQVQLQGHDLYDGDEAALAALRRQFGVMFQAGALWSSMTVGENLMLAMRLFTPLPPAAQAEQARFKLALVGLRDCFDLPPVALSGGMRKRAAIARALALDPALLFLDEPGAGLDPVNTARLDELILRLRDHLGTTVVMVTHEIASVFAVADRMLFLDEQEKTMTALDAPHALLEAGPPRVREFLSVGLHGGGGR